MRQQNQGNDKTSEQPTQAGDSLAHDEAGHDLPAHAVIQIHSPVIHAIVPCLGRDALPQGTGGGLMLFGRQLTV